MQRGKMDFVIVGLFPDMMLHIETVKLLFVVRIGIYLEESVRNDKQKRKRN